MQSPATVPHYLSLRENWQLGANTGGAKLRDTVAEILRAYLDTTYPSQFVVTIEPPDIKQLYYEHDYAQHPEAYARPAAPGPEDVWWDAGRHAFMTMKAGKESVAACGGCTPDVKILCKATGRIYFIECKNQNDAGNAHERCAKYATASVIGLIQKKIGVSYHPIGYLFSGALVEKRKYILELQATYAFARDHLLLWPKERDGTSLVAWLERVVLPLLN